MLQVGEVPKGAIPRTLSSPDETNWLEVSPTSLEPLDTHI